MFYFLYLRWFFDDAIFEILKFGLLIFLFDLAICSGLWFLRLVLVLQLMAVNVFLNMCQFSVTVPKVNVASPASSARGML